MDFFKSVFSDAPEPEPETESPIAGSKSESVHIDPTSSSKQPDANPTEAAGGGGAWNFGGLLKTITSSSGSVIETYRRDLKEFGSELRKEIQVAQGSLGTVGQAIDELGSSVLKGTAEFISQGKEAILAIDGESDSSDNNATNSSQQRLGSKRYSRFEAQVRVIQGNPATYTEEVDDVEDYRKWKSGFVMEGREEIERLLAENSAMESVYTKLVPGSVDEETFWCRYFYKVHKHKQAEELRANLVKRAISSEEDDLSWDVEEEDEEEEDKEVQKGEEEEREGHMDSVGSNTATVAQSVEVIEGSDQNVKNYEVEEMGKSKDEQVVDVKEEERLKGTEKSGDGGNAVVEKVDTEKKEGEGDVFSKSDEKVCVEGKGDNGGSCKDSDFSVVSSRATSQEEEDLGWDEIEDLSGIDEKKVSNSGASLNKVDLHKRLSVAEEEEDLSWDTEDDDEPVKS